MFHHGEERRHLRYHPLEAIAVGMPAIYMRGGSLERYDTGPRLGACANYADARAKIDRLLGETDGHYAAEIAAQQAAMLAPFTRAHCLPQWCTRFRDGVTAQSIGRFEFLRRWTAGWR